MRRFLGLVAVGAVSVALALALIASAGAHTTPGPVIDHCHWWAGHTRVHWHNTWLYSAIGIPAKVDSVTFSWDGPFAQTTVVRPDGSGEGGTAVTPISNQHPGSYLLVEFGIFL